MGQRRATVHETVGNGVEQLRTAGRKETIKAAFTKANMDVTGIRLRNYSMQLAAFAASADQKRLPTHGKLARFAEATGTSARYLSHINNGRKNIGDAVARQIELGLGLQNGYMDNVHWQDMESNNNPGCRTCNDAERNFVATALRLFRDNPVGAKDALNAYASRRARED